MEQIYEKSDTYWYLYFKIRSPETVGVELNNYVGNLFAILIKLILEEIVLEFNHSAKDEKPWNCFKLLEFLKNEIV